MTDIGSGELGSVDSGSGEVRSGRSVLMISGQVNRGKGAKGRTGKLKLETPKLRPMGSGRVDREDRFRASRFRQIDPRKYMVTGRVHLLRRAQEIWRG